MASASGAPRPYRARKRKKRKIRKIVFLIRAAARPTNRTRPAAKSWPPSNIASNTFACPGRRHCVDRKIPAARVHLPVIGERHNGMAPIGLNIAPQRCYLVTPGHADTNVTVPCANPVGTAFEPAALAPPYLFGTSTDWQNPHPPPSVPPACRARPRQRSVPPARRPKSRPCPANRSRKLPQAPC